jgi:hypothetical protein
MIDKLIEIGRYCGMEMSLYKSKVMRIIRQISPEQNMIDQNNWRIRNISII